jgi:hypothetical protein
MSHGFCAIAASLSALALLQLGSPAYAYDACVRPATCQLGQHVPLAYTGSLEVYNIYWNQNWDGLPGHAGFQIAAIDAATATLVNSGYFSNLAQYGVPGVTFGGSTNTNTPFSPCPRNPGPTENLGTFTAFLTCEEAAGALANVPNQSALPSPFCLACGSVPGPACLADPGCLAAPNPTGRVIYNVFLPVGTVLNDGGGAFVSCLNYGAFHAQVPSLPIGGFFTNIAGGRPIYFTVIPVSCVGDISQLMVNVSHELVEAMTDPLPLTSWFDGSTAGSNTSLLSMLENLAKEAEDADICEGLTTTLTAPGMFPFQVSSYWSNSNRSCWAFGDVSPPCTHNECTTGQPLNTSCGACAADLCAVDPYCCTTFWDSICVGEVSSVCDSLACHTDACVHTECSTGLVLSSTCSPCAQHICSVDPYCCHTAWDSICVSEVSTVCGDNCE